MNIRTRERAPTSCAQTDKTIQKDLPTVNTSLCHGKHSDVIKASPNVSINLKFMPKFEEKHPEFCSSLGQGKTSTRRDNGNIQQRTRERER